MKREEGKRSWGSKRREGRERRQARGKAGLDAIGQDSLSTREGTERLQL